MATSECEQHSEAPTETTGETGYIVSWCVGHLVGLKYPNDYGNGWDHKWSFSQLPMIPEKWQFTVTESTRAQYNILKELMNSDSVTEIICATDTDCLCLPPSSPLRSIFHAGVVKMPKS